MFLDLILAYYSINASKLTCLLNPSSLKKALLNSMQRITNSLMFPFFNFLLNLYVCVCVCVVICMVVAGVLAYRSQKRISETSWSGSYMLLSASEMCVDPADGSTISRITSIHTLTPQSQRKYCMTPR